MPDVSSEYEYSKAGTVSDGKQESAKFLSGVAAALKSLAAVAIALLMVAGLLERVELTRKSDINVQLGDELSELKEENRRLQIEYESGIDLSEIEDYAKNVLGMQKPNIEQITEIDTEPQNKIVLTGGSEGGEQADKTGKPIGCITEYFHLR